jgi:hypothetical protein
MNGNFRWFWHRALVTEFSAVPAWNPSIALSTDSVDNPGTRAANTLFEL